MTQKDQRGLLIGALSERTGCNIETIRYYERIGVMPRAPRTRGGHRLYGVEHLKRLNFVRRCRELGFTLDQVRALLRFADSDDYSCKEVKAMTLEHLGEMRKKIADLRKLERLLKDMAVQCDSGTVPDCPILEALFRERSTALSGADVVQGVSTKSEKAPNRIPFGQ